MELPPPPLPPPPQINGNCLTNNLSNNSNNINHIGNSIQNNQLTSSSYLLHNNHHIQTKSATSFNKISPTSVYHLVNNNNNKNDNTLKKRNALVAFEFKTLLDKVSPSTATNSQQCNGSNSADLEEERLNNEISEILPSPPYLFNENQNHFDLNLSNNQNHSPPALSSSSSSSSSSSASAVSSSSQQLIDGCNHIRPISPSNIPRPRIVSPTSNIINGGGGGGNISSINIVSDNRRTPLITNLRSSSQILASTSLTNIKNDNYMSNIDIDKRNQIMLNNGHFVSNNGTNIVTVNNNLNNHPTHNVTIWREELNAKNNVQEQIKKQVNFNHYLIILFY
jgi:hypothetical protein